ncbi:MAG: hypothetical protein GC168_08995 [Candidatus Hydrogenedens sp.]|nr:hypothetical protein [Candidatus Hydrogenedens sp.]
MASAGSLTDALLERVSQMTAEQQSALLMLLSASEGAATETAAADASPEEAIRAQLAVIAKAMKDGDAEALIGVHSDDFEHPQVGGKEALAGYIHQGVDMGYLEDVDMDISDIEFEKDGEDIIAYPIDLSSALGSVTIEWVFRNEDGVWRIVGGDASGL